MFLKTILFIFIFYMLVKTISRLFLPKSNGKKSSFRFFYQTFKNVRDQQKKQQGGQQKSQSGKLDDIEEAEYEDITEDRPESST